MAARRETTQERNGDREHVQAQQKRPSPAFSSETQRIRIREAAFEAGLRGRTAMTRRQAEA